jgi:hypothetical protein
MKTPGAVCSQVEFLKRRYARAIELGDDEHAEICRRLLDLLLNGPLAR